MVNIFQHSRKILRVFAAGKDKGWGLSDDKLLKLSNKFTEYDDLLTVAVKGLEMETTDVKKHVNNYQGKITLAAHDLFANWRKKQIDFRDARAKMVRALEASSFRLYVHECKL